MGLEILFSLQSHLPVLEATGASLGQCSEEEQADFFYLLLRVPQDSGRENIKLNGHIV